MADKGTVQMASTASSNMQQSFFNRWESKNRLKALYNRTFCCPRDIISLAGLPSTLQRGHRAQTFSRRKVKSCEQHVGHPWKMQCVCTGLLNTCFNFALFIACFWAVQLCLYKIEPINFRCILFFPARVQVYVAAASFLLCLFAKTLQKISSQEVLFSLGFWSKESLFHVKIFHRTGLFKNCDI